MRRVRCTGCPNGISLYLTALLAASRGGGSASPATLCVSSSDTPVSRRATIGPCRQTSLMRTYPPVHAHAAFAVAMLASRRGSSFVPAASATANDAETATTSIRDVADARGDASTSAKASSSTGQDPTPTATIPEGLPPPPSPSKPSFLRGTGGDDVTVVELKSDEVRDTFRLSVQARTVGNNQLRKFLKFMNPSDYQMAMDAAAGCRDAGLKLDAETNEMLLTLLLSAGKLREGLELYQAMLQSNICPHTKSYNHLIQLCVDKQSAFAAQTLFKEMQKRGRQPDFETHELIMRSYALENPPKWEKAVQIFDRLQKTRNRSVSASTYNALMTVYLNMSPFDYRVVYNAYHEMRHTVPKIPFGWESYDLVAQGFRKGGAPLWTRFVTYCDAWVQITPVWSPQFFGSILALVVFASVVRVVMLRVAMIFMDPGGRGSSESTMGYPEASG